MEYTEEELKTALGDRYSDEENYITATGLEAAPKEASGEWNCVGRVRGHIPNPGVHAPAAERWMRIIVVNPDYVPPAPPPEPEPPVLSQPAPPAPVEEVPSPAPTDAGTVGGGATEADLEEDQVLIGGNGEPDPGRAQRAAQQRSGAEPKSKSKGKPKKGEPK